jgi:transposase
VRKINTILDRAAGLDVHKDVIVCTVIQVQADKSKKVITQEFKTFRKNLEEMALWLGTFDLTLIVMESTSVYWKAPFEMLEKHHIPAWVVNAHHIKNVPGRKTDVKDSEWLAELAICGLLRASFIPPSDLRELRMLTRYRRKLSGILSAEKNRVQKTLDDSGIKLSSVVSDIDGVSANAMLQIIIDQGSISPDEVIRLAKGKLKAKAEDLKLSLDGNISDRHRFVLKQLRSHIESLKNQIAEIDSQVVKAMEPYEEYWRILQTIPGIDSIGAAMLIAEIGTDMAKFGNKDRFSSWAGVCPGNNESAGKKKADELEQGIDISKPCCVSLRAAQSEPSLSLKADIPRLKHVGGISVPLLQSHISSWK